jgi:flagellar biosynthesis GTPase FlhF
VVQSLLASLAPHEVHLVLPAGMHPARLRQLMAHHRADGVTHLLASKMDEFPDDWSVFELAAERQLPMRWLTDGQGIPGDLRPAAARLEASQARVRGHAYTAAMGVA